MGVTRRLVAMIVRSLDYSRGRATMSHESMLSAEYDECLAILRWSPLDLSVVLDCDERMARRWRAGRMQIPAHVAGLLRTWRRIIEIAPAVYRDPEQYLSAWNPCS